MSDTQGAVNDTSAKSEEMYFLALRQMTPAQRVSLGVALWEAGDATQRAALRRRYPDADESEVLYRLAVSRFGIDVARKVYRRG